MKSEVDTHIAKFPPEVQKKLESIRLLVKTLVPEAIELINYGVPTFKLNGKNLVHYAAFKSHISLFPGAAAVESFQSELSMYKTSKGTIQFPLDEQLPIELIEKIIRSRLVFA